MSNFEKVHQFHRVFGLGVGNFAEPKLNDINLRMTLIEEEYKEVLEAVKTGNIEEVAKELTDLLYVVYGSGVTFGIDLDKTFDVVHNSNMSKLDENGEPIFREDGKILKSDRYVPADLSGVLGTWKKKNTNNN